MNKLMFVIIASVLLAISVFSVYAVEEVAEYRGSFDVNSGTGAIIFDSGQNADSLCGNGVVDITRGEQCDGSVDGNSCASILGGNFQGTLSCQPNCIYDTSKCTVVPTNTGNNNGGSSGSGSSGDGSPSIFPSTSPKTCVEDWGCSDWGICADGNQIRSCADKNSCGTILAKPITERECENKLQIDNSGGNSLLRRFGALLGGVIGLGEGNASNGMVALFLLLVILGVLLIVNTIRKSRLKEKSPDKKIKVEEEE